VLAWVLARNPSRGFYESMGGEPLGSQESEIGGAKLEGVAYRTAAPGPIWPRLCTLQPIWAKDVLYGGCALLVGLP
jgi:hypothetical protein